MISHTGRLHVIRIRRANGAVCLLSVVRNEVPRVIAFQDPAHADGAMKRPLVHVVDAYHRPVPAVKSEAGLYDVVETDIETLCAQGLLTFGIDECTLESGKVVCVRSCLVCNDADSAAMRAIAEKSYSISASS